MLSNKYLSWILQSISLSLTPNKIVVGILVGVVLFGNVNSISLNLGYIFLNKALSKLPEGDSNYFEDSKFWFTQISDNTRQNPSAKWGLGLLLASYDREIEAIQTWQQVDDGVIAERLIAFGRIAEKTQAYNRALLWFERTTQVSPTLGVGWFYLGNMYGKVGQDSLEIATYRKSITFAPDYYESYYALGYILLYKHKSFSEAEQIYESVAQIDPIPIKAYIALSDLYKMSGDHDKSLQFAFVAASLSNGLPLSKNLDEQWLFSLPNYRLAELYFQQGDREKSTRYLCMAVRHDVNYHWIPATLTFNNSNSLNSLLNSCDSITERQND